VTHGPTRPDPIQYAERLYGAIRAAHFSPISFLAFGNAIKDGVSMRNMPRIAAEPFMRVVGEMLDLEEEAVDEELIEAVVVQSDAPATPLPVKTSEMTSEGAARSPEQVPSLNSDAATESPADERRRRPNTRRPDGSKSQ
jgi:hypothetical protein